MKIVYVFTPGLRGGLYNSLTKMSLSKSFWTLDWCQNLNERYWNQLVMRKWSHSLISNYVTNSYSRTQLTLTCFIDLHLEIISLFVLLIFNTKRSLNNIDILPEIYLFNQIVMQVSLHLPYFYNNILKMNITSYLMLCNRITFMIEIFASMKICSIRNGLNLFFKKEVQWRIFH